MVLVRPICRLLLICWLYSVSAGIANVCSCSLFSSYLKAIFADFTSFFSSTPSSAEISHNDTTLVVSHGCVDDVVSTVSASLSDLEAESQLQIEDMKCRFRRLKSLNPIQYWTLLGQEQDCIVWTLSAEGMAAMKLSDEECQWPCVKSHTTINVSAEKLKSLLLDSSLTRRLTQFSAGRADLLSLAQQTKLVWHQMHLPFNTQLDFVSLLHCYFDRTLDAFVVLSQAVRRSERIQPLARGVGRAEILLNVNVIRANALNKHHADITSYNHVSYARARLPALLAWRSAFSGTLSYLKTLRSVAPNIKRNDAS